MKYLYKRFHTFLFTGLALVCCANNAQAQNVRKYSVFKDGKAFVYAQDSVKADNGKTTLPVPPEALFGTLSLSAASSQITSVRSVAGGSAEKRSFSGLQEMLSHNIGKKVRLILAYQEPLEATLSSVVNDFAIFKTKDRWISTSIDKIETIEFLEEPSVQTQQTGTQLEIEWTNRNSTKHLLSTAYMRNGIGWLPEYQITLSGTDELSATLNLRAKLVNDAEDIKGADINFVAGAPNFQFGNTNDPLASSTGIEQILAALQPESDRNNQGYFSNSQAKSYVIPKPDASGRQVFSAQGESAEDLYYYTVNNVNLAKGGRAAYPLIEAKVLVRHIYTVQLGERSQIFSRPTPTQNEQPNTVYHMLELTNNTAHPWTSGSAFVVKETEAGIRPLAQDVLPYAPRSGKTQVKIAAVPEIVVTESEKEISREPDMKQRDGRSYETATFDGDIVLRNYKDKEVTVQVNRSITGEPVKSDISWKITKEPNSYIGVNTVNRVVWEVTLKPGESRNINYKYKASVEK